MGDQDAVFLLSCLSVPLKFGDLWQNSNVSRFNLEFYKIWKDSLRTKPNVSLWGGSIGEDILVDGGNDNFLSLMILLPPFSKWLLKQLGPEWLVSAWEQWKARRGQTGSNSRCSSVQTLAQHTSVFIFSSLAWLVPSFVTVWGSFHTPERGFITQVFDALNSHLPLHRWAH